MCNVHIYVHCTVTVVIFEMYQLKLKNWRKQLKIGDFQSNSKSKNFNSKWV